MKNNLLSESLVYSGKSLTPTHFHLCSYNRTDTKEMSTDDIPTLLSTLDDNGINWLQVHGLKDTDKIETVCNHLGISFLTIQDILNVRHPMKVEDYGSYMVAILRYFIPSADPYEELEEQNISLVLGKNYVLVFLENENNFFCGVKKAIANNVLRIRERHTDYLFSVLLNGIITDYVPKATLIDDRLEDLGSELMSNRASRDMGNSLQALRRQYIQLRQGLAPLREQYNVLLRSDNPLLHRETRPFFNDVNDHLSLTFQTLEICRETFASLTDLYISNNDMRMNAIMKRLTVVSTIFIPLTFLVGVWGMNFKFMPELDWRYGYLFAWGIMVVTAVIITLYFRGKKWN